MKTTFDITPILEVIISIISLIFSMYILPKLCVFLKEKLTEEQRRKLAEWVKVAVTAAEQLYGSKKGKQKKEYVVAFLLSKGIVFDTDEVNALIESEVYKLTQGSGYLLSEPVEDKKEDGITVTDVQEDTVAVG